MSRRIGDIERGTVGQSLDDFLHMDTRFADLRMQVLLLGSRDHCANAVGKFLKRPDVRECLERVDTERPRSRN
jgi:hypothetical protein